MEVKICSKCDTNKEISRFSLEKRYDGRIYRRNVCKNCKQKQCDLEKQKARHRKYGRLNRKKRTAYERNRIKYDTQYKLTRNLRSRIRAAIKNNQKTGSPIKDLGCSISEFKLYIESLWQTNMSWNNYGFGEGKWVIDHIIPLSKVNLSNREEFLKACHYSNLQPMWFEVNSKKGAKIV